ncbi:MAG: LysR family transcriptional regulator [Endozoicomonas sp.]
MSLNFNFNLKSLQIFAAIMDLGTLSKASEAHFISESAASRQISALESQLGFKLFSREKRQLLPTSQGREFYREARRLIQGLQELPDIVENIKQRHHTQLRIITVPRLIRNIVSPAIARICSGKPRLKISVDVQPMRYLQRWLAGFQFHLGLGRLPAEHPDITTRRFCSLPAVAVLPAGHRLSRKSELTLDDLQGETLVATFLRQTLLGRNIVSIYQQQGMQPNPLVETASAFHACSIVASGYGFTIADPLAGHDFGDQIAMVPLKTDFRYDFAFFEPVKSTGSGMVSLFTRQVEAVTAEYMQKCYLAELITLG